MIIYIVLMLREIEIVKEYTVDLELFDRDVARFKHQYEQKL